MPLDDVCFRPGADVPQQETAFRFLGQKLVNLKRASFFLRQRYLLVGFWALAILSMVISLIISFHAGCTGDVKGMTFGDVRRALQLEDYAIVMAGVSASLSAMAFCLTSKSTYRELLGGAFVLIAFLCLWFAGMQVEGQGVRSCFN